MPVPRPSLPCRLPFPFRSPAAFRSAPGRARGRTALWILPLAPLLFVACERTAPDAPTEPKSALYECRGLPEYSPIDWDSLRRELRAHPPACTSPGTDTTSIVILPQATEPPRSVRISMRMVVLDARCGYLAQHAETLSVVTGVMNPVLLWDGRRADGSPAETGEYYVNTEIRWPDGRMDTTYRKVGYIRLDCGG